MHELTVYRRVMCDDTEEWFVLSNVTWGVWQVLNWALKSLKNLQFNRLFLTKVYALAKKLQKSFLSWQWTVMQNLKKNLLMMMTINCFCGMADRQKAFNLFPVGTIVRDPNHLESPTRCEQDLNLRRTWVQTLLNEALQ